MKSVPRRSIEEYVVSIMFGIGDEMLDLSVWVNFYKTKTDLCFWPERLEPIDVFGILPN